MEPANPPASALGGTPFSPVSDALAAKAIWPAVRFFGAQIDTSDQQIQGAFQTPAAVLCPVTYRGQAAMLKVSSEAEETRGLKILAAWDVPAAAPVLVHGEVTDGWYAGIMPLAPSKQIPTDLDLARAAGALHKKATVHTTCQATGGKTARDAADGGPGLVPLSTWFTELLQVERAPSVLPQWARDTVQSAAQTARTLLLGPSNRPTAVLHGDVHHGNLLNFAQDTGPDGSPVPPQWKFIDPKGLVGDPTFDYVNTVFNPALTTSADPQVFDVRVLAMSRAAGLDQTHYLRWILAYGGLSAVWHLEDAVQPALATLNIARLAMERLGTLGRLD